MPLIIVCILTALLIIPLSIWLISDMKQTKKDAEEIEKLREFNLHLDKALDDFKELVELRTKKQNVKHNEIKKKKTIKTI